MRIVVVEDEAATRRSIVRLIERISPAYVVVGESGDGYEGMELITALQPDVALTDIRMPRVDGIGMMDNIRAGCPDTRFIILSGYADFEIARRALQLSAVDYLLKPVTAAQLAESLEAVFQQLDPGDMEGNGHPPREGAAYSPIVAYIVEDVRKHYAQRLYLEDYAGQLRMSPEYAGNLFSRETGKCFSAYLRDLRMEKAKEFLRNTDDKIYEIAYKTGYPDVKYFCRVFKEYTGVSARHYARNLVLQDKAD